MRNGLTAKAAQVAQADLLACSTPAGIIAGTHHFIDLWARDSLFATLGAPSGIAKTTIATFFNYQRDDGAIPYRIFRRGRLLIPNFRSVQSGGFVPDGGLLAMIVADKRKYSKQIQKVKSFYRKKYQGNLISEWFQCEWADAVYKAGKTLYTNILYWKATGDEGIRRQIHSTFWNGTYFEDWFDYTRQDYFAAHPNMLAIVFGLTDKQQANSILTYAKDHCWNGWALEENYPRYPFWRIPLQNYIAGVPDYHNRGMIWLQPTIVYAVALHKSGRRKEAKNVLEKVAETIVKYGGVYEVYEKNGKPARRMLYRAEHPFAWSAGLYLWAESLLQ